MEDRKRQNWALVSQYKWQNGELDFKMINLWGFLMACFSDWSKCANKIHRFKMVIPATHSFYNEHVSSPFQIGYSVLEPPSLAHSANCGLGWIMLEKGYSPWWLGWKAHKCCPQAIMPNPLTLAAGYDNQCDMKKSLFLCLQILLPNAQKAQCVSQRRTSAWWPFANWGYSCTCSNHWMCKANHLATCVRISHYQVIYCRKKMYQ